MLLGGITITFSISAHNEFLVITDGFGGMQNSARSGPMGKFSIAGNYGQSATSGTDC